MKRQVTKRMFSYQIKINCQKSLTVIELQNAFLSTIFFRFRDFTNTSISGPFI